MNPERFASLWRSLEPIGRDPSTGGYLRYAWSPAERQCREWFKEEALDRNLVTETDGNGNVWAWWGDPAAGGAIVSGSHLDSVPQGGAFDGPLGIVSALLAIDLLREREVALKRPIGIVAFSEEEGSRFGVACLGSRLLTGALDADRARSLLDPDGVSLTAAMGAGGDEAGNLGADPGRLSAIAAFIEVHIEQGRALGEAPVGIASAIWPHGRWRLDVTGEPNHAGTTRMADRHDPMLTLAHTIIATDAQARLCSGLATIGRLGVEPNATNAVASRITAWLDARAPDQSTLEMLVESIRRRCVERSAIDQTTVDLTRESVTLGTEFDAPLRDRLLAILGAVPVLPTGAGHDAGVLAAAGIPAAMLFVRNPTGVSHAPGEHATDADCAAGVKALASVLEDLACR